MIPLPKVSPHVAMVTETMSTVNFEERNETDIEANFVSALTESEVLLDFDSVSTNIDIRFCFYSMLAKLAYTLLLR